MHTLIHSDIKLIETYLYQHENENHYEFFIAWDIFSMRNNANKMLKCLIEMHFSRLLSTFRKSSSTLRICQGAQDSEYAL